MDSNKILYEEGIWIGHGVIEISIHPVDPVHPERGNARRKSLHQGPGERRQNAGLAPDVLLSRPESSTSCHAMQHDNARGALYKYSRFHPAPTPMFLDRGALGAEKSGEYFE
jgi:hypothetical protein